VHSEVAIIFNLIGDLTQLLVLEIITAQDSEIIIIQDSEMETLTEAASETE